MLSLFVVTFNNWRHERQIIKRPVRDDTRVARDSPMVINCPVRDDIRVAPNPTRDYQPCHQVRDMHEFVNNLSRMCCT